MDELAREYYDTARVVTKEEAARNLVSAIILRAVLDYRNILVENIEWTGTDYDIHPTDAMLSLERFFDNIGFNLHKKLINGVLEFHRNMRELKDDDFKKTTETAFICPICGGSVRANYVINRSGNLIDHKKVTKKIKKCACQDCLIKMVMG